VTPVPRRPALLLAALCAAALAAPGPAAAAGPPAPPRVLPGDAGVARAAAARPTWIVGARPGRAAEAVARRCAARRIGPRTTGGYVVARRRARAFAGALRARGVLVYAEPDALRTPRQAPPPEPRSGPPDDWRDSVADPALVPPPVTPTSPLIAFVDARLDEAHPEFAGGSTTTLGDLPLSNPHGTATAAIAAAPRNGVGILGVWPGARALNVPVAAPIGCAVSARKIYRAVEAGAAVINMSYGSADPCYSEYVALQHAVARGVIPVAAAGNEFETGNPPEFPASLPHVVTVAAVAANRRSSAFSNANEAIDLSAPGERILTAVPAAMDGDGTPDGYEALTGTSFSAPMVAAAAAWIRAARPTLTPDQVVQVLRISARDLPPRGWDRDTGFGLLSIGAALERKAPRADPGEPNDDMIWVDGRAFGQRSGPIHAGGRRTVLRALLDRYEDPADVYRVIVQPRTRVKIAVRPTFGDPALRAYAGGTRTLRRGRPVAVSRRRGERTERIALENPGSRRRTYLVAVTVQARARNLDAGYVLSAAR
jgi:hypothetical protein